MMHSWMPDTANGVYPKVINTIMHMGVQVGIDRPEAVDNVTYEVHPAIITLRNPQQRLITSYGRPMNVAFALAEVLWILAGRRDVEMLAAYNSTISQFSDDGLRFNAAYGHRLRTDFGVDQIEDVIRTLRDDPSSRQATLVISNPVDDKGWDRVPSHNGGVSDWNYVKHATKDRACNVLSHLMIRNNALDWMQIVRSNDAVWGTPYNWMQFTHLMEWIAGTLGAPMIDYKNIVDSLHIYRHHFDEAAAIKQFDLYDYAGTPSLMRTGQQTLNIVLREEEVIRKTRADWSLPGEDMDKIGHYWHSVLQVLYAHRLYSCGEDMRCAQVLSYTHPLYGWAQARFYFQNRWWKEGYLDCLDVLEMSPDVYSWATTRIEDK